MINRLKRLFKKSEPVQKKLPFFTFPSYKLAAEASVGYAFPELLELKLHQGKEQAAEYLKRKESKSIPADRLHFQNLWVFGLFEKAGIQAIYELGGAVGTWKMILNVFTENRFLNWTIQEQPALVKRVVEEKLDAELGITFMDSLEKKHLTNPEKTAFFAQGVLQYMPDLKTLLKDVFAADFAFVYLTRTPFLTSETGPVFVQQRHYFSDHAPGFVNSESEKKIVSIPMTLYSLSEILSWIPESYELVFSSEETKPRTLPVENAAIIAQEMSLLFKKKK